MIKLRRMLFINPAALKTTTNTKSFQAGDIIFIAGDKADSVYYIRYGSITEQIDGSPDVVYEKGSFVGDTLCLLDENYRGNGIATTDCKLIVFTTGEFKELMKKSPKAAAKALAKMTDF